MDLPCCVIHPFIGFSVIYQGLKWLRPVLMQGARIEGEGPCQQGRQVSNHGVTIQHAKWCGLLSVGS